MSEEVNTAPISQDPKVKAAEDELIQKMYHIVSYVPTGMRDTLHLLMHPDVILLTDAYIEAWMTASGMCLTFKQDWDCNKEIEKRRKIASERLYRDPSRSLFGYFSRCPNCRKKNEDVQHEEAGESQALSDDGTAT